MNRSLLWRFILILAVVGLAAWSAYPPREKINLGLDLQGGMHLVLKVETDDALRAEADQDAADFLEQAREEGLTAARLVRGTGEGEGGEAEAAEGQSPARFVLAGVPLDEGPAVDRALEQSINRGVERWEWRREEDRLVFTMDEGEVQQIRRQAVDQALKTIRNRVDAFGVAEPVIHRQGFADSERIVVQLPGVDDPERVKRLIKNTAFLEFRLVDFPPSGGGVPTREAVLEHYGGRLPDNVELLEGDQLDDQGRVIGEQFYGVERQRVVTGRDLKNARPARGQFGEPIVEFTFSYEAGQRFAQFTGDNVGRGLGIVLDGRVVSAPSIRDRIAESGIITGNFSQQEVVDLSTALRSGALPAGITYLEERTVGPSLGQDSIRQGVRAGLWGGLLVVVTMLVVYLLAGVNAILALSLNVVLVFGALAALGATLTLPGIAGIVLTIGMAVDANVLVFERIREELRNGRTVRSSVDSGFGKALSSILDANFTTLIAAVFLFQFGTGPIQGFAVTLSIGILASVFTAVFVSRWIFDLVLSRRRSGAKLSI